MTTSVAYDDAIDPIVVDLPPGWSRVWEGPIQLGDHYIDCGVLVNTGFVVWKRIGADDLIEAFGSDLPCYEEASTYLCLIRERPNDVGKPCHICGVRPPEWTEPGEPRMTVCWQCHAALPIAEELED